MASKSLTARPYRFDMMLSAVELDTLDRFAQAWGLTRSDVVRRLLRETPMVATAHEPTARGGRPKARVIPIGRGRS